MADRYWVGGAGTWNTTSTTNWSATPGGASGASVPTVADSVFFDRTGTYTVTMTGALACLDITVSAGNVTFATGTTPTLDIRGSMSLLAGTVWSSTGAVTFSSTATGRTVTTNGVTITGAVTFSGVGGAWTLGSALTTSGNLTISNGTFNTGNFNVTCSSLGSTSGTTRTITLGSSTVTCSASFQTTTTALTFNANTSTIICTGATVTFQTNNVAGPGLTFNNVSFTSTSTAGTATISVSSNTFNNFTVTGPASAGVRQVAFDAAQTINGTLSTTGTAGNRRVWFASSTYGLARTLTINSAPSLTDADFRDLYVVGTAAPISGTRIGDLRGIRGITASTPKTVYWNLPAGGNWSATAWAASSGGAVSTNNHPLAQDTAIIENTGLNAAATVTLDAALGYIGAINMSTRTNAMTLNVATAQTVYGNWTNGSGTTMTGTVTITFSGRNTQTITSAGRSFPRGVTIDSYGGSVELADAFTLQSGGTLTVNNGTFDTKNFNVTADALVAANNFVRAVTLGSSTVTLVTGGTPVNFTSTNLTLNVGTSTINLTAAANAGISAPGLSLYNVSITGTSVGGLSSISAGGFNNLTLAAPATTGFTTYSFGAGTVIAGTLTCAGASPVRRLFVQSSVLGVPRTLTAATLSATDCDFRDITIAGAAAGSTPTRAGDCGGNTGITFPSPKTVYWNLAGTQNWSATGWAPSSGGTVNINQFPLAQDTAVFDNTGAAGTVTIESNWNIGTVDFSARTSAMTFSATSSTPSIYGDWRWGTGVTSSSTTGTIFFRGRGTETITSNGVQFGCNVTVDSVTGAGKIVLADALSLASARSLILTSGELDAATYNVTIGAFNNNAAAILRMGSGTWTLTGTGTVWNINANTIFYKGTANIVLSDTSTTARAFSGAASYNRLTIGGTTGISTLTFNGNNQFTELASTKTVAHTIALGTTTQTLGAWTITGTAGNVVTVTGTATITIAGSRVSGVNFLALGTTVISATSPGEFYAGANSTGGTNAILTAAPAPVTRYWRGGTGTWDASTTTNWSATSGGAGGASVPTSADAVVFDSASNATAYTVTCTATQLRCGSLTIAGPASGNVTWAGTAPLAIHGNVTLPATGMTRTYTGAITLTSNSTGLTFTTNGVTLLSPITVNGENCGWSLGSALTIANGLTNPVLTVTRGTFNTANFNFTSNSVNGSAFVNISGSVTRTVSLGSSTITIAHGAGGGASYLIDAGDTPTNLTFNAGTSQITGPTNGAGGLRGSLTFYNVSYTAGGDISGFVGTNTFNNLSFTGRPGVGISTIPFFANQTVNGTLTVTAGTNATCRNFIRSNTIGTTRTITAAAVSLTDVDFRDITIAGAAAPASGTRLGDAKGNSGITFTTPKTVYWNLAGSPNWSATAWALTSGGSPAVNNFPLAQDTAIFNNAGSAGAVILDAGWNIGTVDMSSRTSAVTFSTSTGSFIHGNWSNGSGTAWGASTGILYFVGRTSQTLTSAGKTFTPSIFLDSPGGTLTLQDALTIDRNTGGALTVTRGTFNASTYNVTLSGATSSFDTSNSNTRTVAVGSGTWTIAGTSVTAWGAATSTNLTVTGTGTISLTSASSKTFAGGDANYAGITLNQGGGGLLTISGNNTFKAISNTHASTGSTTISLGNTTQRVEQWLASGQAGRVLTVSGSSSASVATLVFTGTQNVNVDYLSLANVRAYNINNTWYAGANSTNGGTLGWIFQASPISYVVVLETATGTDLIVATVSTPSVSASVLEAATGSDSIVARVLFRTTISESGTGTDTTSARQRHAVATSDAATATETISSVAGIYRNIAETASATETARALGSLRISLLEQGTGTDQISGRIAAVSQVSESGTGTDTTSARARFASQASESATATETISSVIRIVRSIAETASATDAVAAVQKALGVVTDTATATEIVQAFRQLQGVLSESATATEQVSGRKTAVGSVAESATGTEQISALSFFTRAIIEAATGSDTIATTGVLNIPVVETATASDSFAVRGTFYSSVSLTVTIADTVLCRYLWEPVDDTQVPNWQTISNTQSAGWVLIPNTQVSGWIPVKTIKDT